MNCFALRLTIIILLAFIGCVGDVLAGGQGKTLRNKIEDHIKHFYPMYSLYTVEDMDVDARQAFIDIAGGDDPGFTCFSLGVKRFNCAVLISNKRSVIGAAKLIVFEDIMNKDVRSVVLEDYEAGKDLKWPGCRSVYLKFTPKQRVANHDPDAKNENDIIEMKSDGFEVVFYEKASRIYYWDGRDIKLIVTSD